MADRRAELEKKRLKLNILREQNERRKREKIYQKVNEQEVDQLFISVGVDINRQRGDDFSFRQIIQFRVKV